MPKWYDRAMEDLDARYTLGEITWEEYNDELSDIEEEAEVARQVTMANEEDY